MTHAPARVGLTDTRYFLPLSRLERVQPIERGILATLDHEWLRVEFIRDDIVRLKISRGGVFDEHPTYAVAVDVMATPIPAFHIVETEATVVVRGVQLEVVIERDPFSVRVCRADGSVVAETARGPDGMPWAYATLNDAFAFHRVCTREDAFLGLGEKTGRLNRKGRDFILWNNDVLSPHRLRPNSLPGAIRLIRVPRIPVPSLIPTMSRSRFFTILIGTATPRGFFSIIAIGCMLILPRLKRMVSALSVVSIPSTSLPGRRWLQSWKDLPG